MISILLLIIATLSVGYKNFIKEQENRPKLEEKNVEEK